MIKKWLRIILVILLFFLILPYFIPVEFEHEIPEKPYSNSRFFTVDNISIHTQIYPVDHPKGKIVFIHGLGASTASFRHNAPFFNEQGYFVISIDLPAFGYSSKARNIDHSQMNRAQLIWQILNQIDLETNNDPWHLVGHSMGGSTVLAMTELQPSHVKTLNLIAGAVTSDVDRPNWLLKTPLGQYLKIALRYFMINEKQFANILESAMSSTPSKENIRYYLEPLQTKGTISALLDFVQTSDNFLISEFSVKNVPINLFWGKKDTWVSVDSIDEIKKYVEINSIELFNDGHLVHETSEEFNPKLLEKLITP